MNELITLAPGRTCLFGDHQDYLGLPIIACAIDRHIRLVANKNDHRIFDIKKPDIQKERIIHIDDEIHEIEKGDHLLAALKVLKRYGCIPNQGYDITISGDLPINAGTSSSSALVISWIQFLAKAFGPEELLEAETISQLAYEAEVVEQKSPGGKMDQYSIGLGNIIYLETGEELSYEVIHQPLPGLIIGESGIPKPTLGVLKDLREKAWAAIHYLQKTDKAFDIKAVEKEELSKYLSQLPEEIAPYFYAAVSNHDITKRAMTEFRKPDPNLEHIGSLINEHHQILRDVLKITLPKIDDMINAALNAGAYGAKIVGSGKGGSIVALAPEDKEEVVINAIKAAGGRDAYSVAVDPGARVLQASEVA